jgi:hypothetical protein
VKRRLPKVAPTRWNFNSQIAQTVHEYRDPLVNFIHIVDSPDDWDTETYLTCPGFWFLSRIVILYIYCQFSTNYFLLVTLFEI